MLAGVVAGCGGGGNNETAGAFITRILREEIAGQWAKQWDDLNPGHKRLITQDQYVLCSKGLKTSVGTASATIKVKSVKDEPSTSAVPRRPRCRRRVEAVKPS